MKNSNKKLQYYKIIKLNIFFFSNVNKYDNKKSNNNYLLSTYF